MAATALNATVELECGCNCMTNGVLPKPGLLACGDAGIEFVPTDSSRHVRLSWNDIELIRVDIFRGEVRTLDVHASDGQVTTLIPEDGVGVIRLCRDHLGRERLESVNESAPASSPEPRTPLAAFKSLFGR